MFDEKFWAAVSFFILVALVWKPLKSLLKNGLDNRAAQIKHELDEAVRLKEEAETLLVSYQRKQKEALEDAKNILAHAEEEVKRMTEEAHKEIEATLAKRMQLTKDKIAAHEKQVLEEVYNHAIDVAVEAVRKVLKDSLDPATADQLVQSSISAVGQKLKLDA